jgi:hypothetical protein
MGKEWKKDIVVAKMIEDQVIALKIYNGIRHL